MKLFYELAIIYNVAIAVYLSATLKKSTNHNIIYFTVSSIVANCGYLWSTFANDIGEAIIGLKVQYLGSIPLCFFTFLLIATICQIKIPRVVKYLLGTASGIVLVLAMTVGRSQIFYKGIEFVKEENYSYLIKEYGPVHSLYIVLVMLYMIASLCIAIRALFTPVLVPGRMAFAIAMTEVLTIIIYFGERAIGLRYEFLPFAYSVSVTICSVGFLKQYTYDADRVAIDIRDANKENGVILFDKKRRFLGCNDAIKSIFTESEKYYVEKPITDDLFGKKYFDDLLDAADASDSEIYDQTIEYHERIYRVRVRKHAKDSSVGFSGYVIEFIDDTLTQNYIKRINEMNAELETSVEETKAASNAKSSFLANMSHEIRTPINAILGFNSIIMRDTNELLTRDYARDIDSAGKSLLAIINDVLDFSKIEAGRMDVVTVDYKLASLISDCRNMIYGKLVDKGLEFKLICDEKLPSVLSGDEIRLRQIVTNLLSNSAKYTDTGSVTLSVGGTVQSANTIMLELKVSDTGMGISKENQKHLFESFRRVDVTRNRNIEGTGLGLALVDNLTQLMGGSVSVESEIGKGSEFTVRIPQEIVSLEPIGTLEGVFEQDDLSSKMDDLSDTQGEILVVDDVALNIKVFVQLLKKSKLNIDTAESGQEAIKKAHEKKYDIIFLDHMMPVMDGIEAFHKMKEDSASPNVNTPVVMLTANAISGVRDEYISEGLDDYLSKPVNFEMLKDVILKYL